MNDETLQLIRATQVAMTAGSKPAFDKDDVDHLRTIVRITIEFNGFLESFQPETTTQFDLEYRVGSILSGIESFSQLTDAYVILIGAQDSEIGWEIGSLSKFRAQFEAKYVLFLATEEFERKCRLLLDLFKMQIVFVGVLHR